MTITAGWWVVLEYWENDMAFGPYPDQATAVAAMEDAPLIDSQCCDTKWPDILDDVKVLDQPGTVAGIIEAYGPDHVVIIDPDDPDHFAPKETP